jgi:hypothetical protein
MPNAADRDYLRTVIAVALAMVPRRVRQDFADRNIMVRDAAQRQLSEAAADAVLQCFNLERKPLPPSGTAVAARPEQ